MIALKWLDRTRQDARLAVRALRKAPAVAALACLFLAQGLGANAAIFAVIDARLLRPLPYPDAESLVRASETMPRLGKEWTGSVSWANFEDWRNQVATLSGLAAYVTRDASLRSPDGTERVSSIAATGNLFTVLGATTLIGRGLEPADDSPGAAHVAVVSERLWRHRFQADPGLIGQTVTLDGAPHVVVGVAPDAAMIPPDRPVDVIVPLAPSPGERRERGLHFLTVVGRLRSGVSVDHAAAELNQVAARIEQEDPVVQAGRRATAVSLAESVSAQHRTSLIVLFGAGVLLLLIACANVANLLLARATSRQHEIAVRRAVGASTSDLLRQLLWEAALLSMAGAVLGLVIAAWGVDVFAMVSERGGMGQAGPIRLHWPTFMFLVVVTTASAFMSGVAPALHAARSDLRPSLNLSAGVVSGSRSVRSVAGALVASQLALSFALVTGTGLLVKSYAAVAATRPGIDPSNVVTARIAIGATKRDPAAIAAAVLSPLLQQLRASPGIRDAAVVSLLPVRAAGVNADYEVEGEAKRVSDQGRLAEVRLTSPGFFRAMGIPIVAGRDLTELDGAQGGSVIVVNEALSKRHFAGTEAVGRRIILGGTPFEIVGVVGDVRQAGLDVPPLAEMHLPYNRPEFGGLFMGDVTLVMKHDGPAATAVAAARATLRAQDPDVALYEVSSMDKVIATSTWRRRVAAQLLAVLALVAVGLAIVGVYGVMSYHTAQRTREIGVRLAIGARPRDVLFDVLRGAASLTGIGIALGAIGAALLARSLETQLYDVQPWDVVTFAAAGGFILVVAIGAAWLPARRAAAVEPAVALKGA